jgi:hypothetical protein
MRMINYCQRCGEQDGITTMSRFNTQTICIPCEKLERAHPNYKAAQEAEMAACKRGNYNYHGIGKPGDL